MEQIQTIKEAFNYLGKYTGIEPYTKDNCIINFENGKLLSSYNKIIAIKIYMNYPIITNYYSYSKTTGKYRNKFLNMDKKIRRKY